MLLRNNIMYVGHSKLGCRLIGQIFTGLLLAGICFYSIPSTAEDEIFPLFSLPKNEPIRSEAPSPEDRQHWELLRSKILSDFGQRISDDFKVDPRLRDRISFWFDIYAKFGEAHHVIHHQRYPWIVYQVVDTTETLLNSSGPAWLRRERAEKIARARVTEIRMALRKLAKRKSFDHLSRLEQQLFDKLSVLPGKRTDVIRLAARTVRSQLGQRDFFAAGLANSGRYLNLMDAEFKRLGLPTELTRMPFVESSFNEAAYSKVGASGIWQILPQTGRAYMIVNPHIDERNSPLKATITAGRLLRSYYQFLKSWPLAVTSYNNGIGNIQRAIRQSHSRELPDIIDRYHRGDFRFASSNFYSCFIAALFAEKYHELIFKDIPRLAPDEIEIIRLSSDIRTKNLTRLTGLEIREILHYNLDLRLAIKQNSVLPRGYKLHLPPSHRYKVTQI